MAVIDTHWVAGSSVCLLAASTVAMPPEVSRGSRFGAIRVERPGELMEHGNRPPGECSWVVRIPRKAIVCMAFMPA